MGAMTSSDSDIEDIDTRTVVVGYLHGDHLTQEFHHCLFRFFIHDMWGPNLVRGFLPQMSGVQVATARNAMVTQFLDNEHAEWLWMLDSDATFAPTMLDSLLAVADPTDRPIVGALAHKVRAANGDDGQPVIDSHGSPEREIVPTMYRALPRGADGHWIGYQEIETYGKGLMEVDATGTHCLLVHRSVFEKIESDHPHRWFRESVIGPGILAGEDITFCLQARDHGFPVYVDTRLESGHVKPFIMTSNLNTEDSRYGRIC